jgi:dTDP-4-dehydrorhamnose reductase
MNILVTGASGLVGSHLLSRLDGIHSIIGIARRKPSQSKYKSTSFFSLDMISYMDLNNFLINSELNIVINCAAMPDVDLCEIEKEKASAINAEAVRYLAAYCKDRGILLIQISTDYIFDGVDGPFLENSIPNPINHYGRSKLEAEEIIQQSGCDYIIARTVHIYGNLPDSPSKQVAWLLSARDSGREISGAVDQFSNPTWAGNLADALIELMYSDIRGIIHIGGGDYLSRYDFAVEGSKLLGIDSNLIKKTTLEKLKLTAPRPLRAGLNVEKMKLLLKTQPMSIREGLIKVQAGNR